MYGVHVSNKELTKNIEKIINNGGSIIQIFLSGPYGKNIDNNCDNNLDNNCDNNCDKIDILKYHRIKHDIKIYVHSPYIINLCHIRKYQMNLLKREIELVNDIGSIGIVLHVGKSLDLNIDVAIINMYNNILQLYNYIVDNKFNVKLLIETPAGVGSEVLTKLDDLLLFYNTFTRRQKQIIKICIDTCHLYSSGYDVCDIKGLFKILKKFRYSNIGLVHLNNSKTKFNSHIDRHESIINKGYIQCIRELIISFIKNNIPFILEKTIDIENELKYISDIIKSM